MGECGVYVVPDLTRCKAMGGRHFQALLRMSPFWAFMTLLMEQGALAILSGLDLKGLIIKPGSSVLVLNE